jgi:endonuclease/exonuclease/phosphatase (EEP) superfamily protein YafD
MEPMARTRRFFSLVLLLALVSPFTTGCVVGDESDSDLDDVEAKGTDTASIKIVQHNIEKKNDPLMMALGRAENLGADGITLQEVCPQQLDWLVATYTSKWTIVAVQKQTPAVTGCANPGVDRPFTVVIWRGGPGGTPAWFPEISGITGAPGGMACVEFPRGGVAVDLCSVHLNSTEWGSYSGEDLRLRETTRIKQITKDTWLSRGHFVIVGGDFNGKPTTVPLDKMYDESLGGTGDFTEYNRSGPSRDGRNTAHSSGDHTDSGEGYDRKIDYIFFSSNRAPREGDAVDITTDASDHDMVTSLVRMRK